MLSSVSFSISGSFTYFFNQECDSHKKWLRIRIELNLIVMDK